MGGFLSTLGNIGMGVLNSAAGGALGMLMQGQADRRQLDQERELQKLQMQSSKEMTEFNMKKQLEMWEKTSYPAQLAMMKKAGLSPGLMYGGGGGGGTTANIQQGNVSRGNAPTGGGEIQAGMAMAMQQQMMQSQIDVNKSQAEKNRAEADSTRGVEGTIGAGTIANLAQQTNNAKGQEYLIELDRLMKGLDLKMANETYDDRKQTVEYTRAQAYKRLQLLTNESAISDDTYNQVVELVDLQVAQATLDLEATKAGIQLTEQQVKGIAQSIKTQIKQLEQGDRSLDQEDKYIVIQQVRNNLIKEGIWVQGISNVIGTAVDAITKGRGMRQQQRQYERTQTDQEYRTEKMKDHR